MSVSKHNHLKNGTEVYIDRNDSRDFDYFVKKFNKKVQKHRILLTLSEKRFYEKPCDKRNRKHRESVLRIKKEALKAEKEKSKSKKYIKDSDE